MQGIYTYIPETNYVLREYSVAAMLLLLFMVLISLVSVLNLLYFYISTFRRMCAFSLSTPKEKLKIFFVLPLLCEVLQRQKMSILKEVHRGGGGGGGKRGVQEVETIWRNQ